MQFNKDTILTAGIGAGIAALVAGATGFTVARKRAKTLNKAINTNKVEPPKTSTPNQTAATDVADAAPVNEVSAESAPEENKRMVDVVEETNATITGTDPFNPEVFKTEVNSQTFLAGSIFEIMDDGPLTEEDVNWMLDLIADGPDLFNLTPRQARQLRTMAVHRRENLAGMDNTNPGFQTTLEVYMNAMRVQYNRYLQQNQ